MVSPRHAARSAPLAAARCEFCAELASRPSARFPRIYDSVLRDRVVDREGDWIAMPTIGQLFGGSLLILPVEHVETVARAEAHLGLDALERLVERLRRRLRPLGHPVLFEHGALSCTGGSCGIYHAHLHLVPTPEPLSVGELLPWGCIEAASLGAALGANLQAQQYLLACDGQRRVGYVQPGPADRERYPSQYLRRFLVRRFGLAASWDWRESDAPEPLLLDTVELLRGR